MVTKKERVRARRAGPNTVKTYRATFRPFTSTKYLDEVSLRKVAKTTIEIGTVEAPGISFTLVAEVRKGMITRLAPVSCRGCKRGRVAKAPLSCSLNFLSFANGSPLSLVDTPQSTPLN
jgi:hypothetical protein